MDKPGAPCVPVRGAIASADGTGTKLGLRGGSEEAAQDGDWLGKWVRVANDVLGLLVSLALSLIAFFVGYFAGAQTVRVAALGGMILTSWWCAGRSAHEWANAAGLFMASAVMFTFAFTSI